MINSNNTRIITCLILCCATLLLSSCGTSEKTPLGNLKDQAKEMSDAFLNEDFIAVTNRTSPLVFKLVGGKENLIEGLKKSVGAMKAQGMSFNRISFADPSGIIEHNGQLQATIAQQTEIKYSGGVMKSNSILIALSDDKGKSWKFIDTAGKDTASIRQAFPELSPALEIPTPTPAGP